MKKNFLTVFFILITASFFARGMREGQQSLSKINVAVLNGPSAIPMAFMEEISESETLAFEYSILSSVDVLIPRLSKGEVDFAILPPNVAAKLYNLNKDIQVLGIVGNGMLSLITRDTDITSLADLENKDIYIAGSGATPEYIFKYLLKQNNLEDKNISLNFSIPAQEIPAAFLSRKINYAIVPEPFTTVITEKDKDAKRAVNIQQEWSKITDIENYPMSVIVVKKDFAEKHPEIVKRFAYIYRNAIYLTNENPDKAGSLCEKYSIGLKKDIVKKCIPNAAFVYIDGNDAKKSINQLLKVFLQFSPAAIGNKLPDSNFYFHE